MLRSEVKWFPVFLDLCKHSYSFLAPGNMDYEAMHRVVHCQNFREVNQFLNEYKETAFSDEIFCYRSRAEELTRQGSSFPVYIDVIRIQDLFLRQCL
jgi:hypothetical protein